MLKLARYPLTGQGSRQSVHQRYMMPLSHSLGFVDACLRTVFDFFAASFLGGPSYGLVLPRIWAILIAAQTPQSVFDKKYK